MIVRSPEKLISAKEEVTSEIGLMKLPARVKAKKIQGKVFSSSASFLSRLFPENAAHIWSGSFTQQQSQSRQSLQISPQAKPMNTIPN